MREISMIVDGEWVPVKTTGDTVDQIVEHLSQVVLLAQGLSSEDQRRARDFVRATLSTLEATTSLPRADQKVFEMHLRDIARR